MTATGSEPIEFPGARRCPVDPPEHLTEVQAAGGLSEIRMWDGSVQWLATGYQDVRAVLFGKSFSADSDSPGYPHHSAGSQARKENHTKMFVSLDDPKHRELRRMATPEFTIKNVESLRPSIRDAVRELITEIKKGPNPVDLVETFSLVLPSVVISSMMGIAVEDRPMFHDASCVLTSRTATPAEAVGALETMRTYFLELIERRKIDPGEDIVSRLVTEQLVPGHVELDDLVSILELLVVGGHDTTNNMIALGTAVLLQHPDVWEELGQSDDPALHANTVEELLRYLGIFHMGRGRAVVDDAEVGGQALRKGDGIVAALNVANRDPEVFANPNEFDVHRPNARSHLAFGFGIHQCLGQTLARIELQEAYRGLAQQMPTLQLVGDFDDLPFKEDSVVYGLHALPVTW